MNTTELIRHWTMEGASEDVGAHFAPIDVDLASSEDDDNLIDAPPAPFRMRESDEEEWRPLLLGANAK